MSLVFKTFPISLLACFKGPKSGLLCKSTGVGTVTIKILQSEITFSSDVITSEPIQLSSVAIESPSNLEVFVMPFPENYQEYEVPVVPVSGVI